MKIVALAGGVGGAKLADGLAQLLCSKDLTIVVNTGDDFEHLGLNISPDLDTVCYALAGLGNPDTGWGRNGDTFHMLEYLHKIGGPTWFRLGDQDLATHIERTRRLKIGQPLSQITRDFCRVWDVQHPIIPMTDQVVSTMVNTVEDGELAFQEYFVHRNCKPKVKGFRFTGIESALPAPGVLDSINQADAVILCPSNPWVSIDPILALPVIRSVLKTKCVVAVSPIINGHAVKGPAAKMYAEMGILPSAVAVARHYNKLLSGFVMDASDVDLSADITIPFVTTKTMMKTKDDRRRLAEDVLNLIQHL
ncbi:MAG TPA: 2-phospho-L-lactate transferase [Anaerolineales bacterium]